MPEYERYEFYAYKSVLYIAFYDFMALGLYAYAVLSAVCTHVPRHRTKPHKQMTEDYDIGKQAEKSSL